MSNDTTTTTTEEGIEMSDKTAIYTDEGVLRLMLGDERSETPAPQPGDDLDIAYKRRGRENLVQREVAIEKVEYGSIQSDDVVWDIYTAPTDDGTRYKITDCGYISTPEKRLGQVVDTTHYPCKGDH